MTVRFFSFIWPPKIYFYDGNNEYSGNKSAEEQVT